MQLTLRVTRCPDDVVLVSRAFGVMGGVIGRSPDCTLALPDPLRYISRVHAEIRCVDGDFFLKVLSKVNPVGVNGSPVGFNQMVALKAGDQVSLGDYSFVAEVSGDAENAQNGLDMHDPFAMFDQLSSPGKPDDDTLKKQDPFFREAAPKNLDPDTVLGGRKPPSDSSLYGLIQSEANTSSDPLLGILRNEDAKPADKKGRTSWSRTPAAPTNSDNSAVDRFLGDGSPNVDTFGLASTPHSDSTLPGVGGLGNHSNHVHDINLPFPPLGRKDSASPANAHSHASAPSSTGQTPTSTPDDVFAVLNGLIATPRPAQAADQSLNWDAVTSPPPPQTAHDDIGEQIAMKLIASFAEGLEMPGLKVSPTESQTFMLELGRMFRSAIAGIHALLLLRAEVKKELRADDRTMIASRENNPLKHTESIEEALNYLLDFSTPNPAFLPPVRAMEDAFNDMRAHELAVMAGMRAGVSGVLNRFDPKTLETRIKKTGAMDSVIPALYKAKLWDCYTEFYKDIESEAEDHFDKLFGRAFVRAYMEQTKQLKKIKKN